MVSISDYAIPPTAYTESFADTAWSGSGPATLEILGTLHLLETVGYVQVTDTTTNEVVQVGVAIDPANQNVTLTSTTAFDCKVDIRS